MKLVFAPGQRTIIYRGKRAVAAFNPYANRNEAQSRALPREIEFHLTRKCMFRCVDCFGANFSRDVVSEDKINEADIDRVFAAVQTVLKQGDLPVPQIVISGWSGEALLRKGLVSCILKHARDLHAPIVVHTTGALLLSPELIDLLNNPAVVSSINFSVDSPLFEARGVNRQRLISLYAKGHGIEIVQAERAFDNLLVNIRMLSEEKVRSQPPHFRLVVKYLLKNENVDLVQLETDFINTILFLSSLATVNELKLSPPYPAVNSLTASRANEENVRGIIQRVAASLPSDLSECLEIYYKYPPDPAQDSRVSCDTNKVSLVISPAGDVYPCCFAVHPQAFPNYHLYGNVKRENFIAIWRRMSEREIVVARDCQAVRRTCFTTSMVRSGFD